jgi:hypothetical protein
MDEKEFGERLDRVLFGSGETSDPAMDMETLLDEAEQDTKG